VDDGVATGFRRESASAPLRSASCFPDEKTETTRDFLGTARSLVQRGSVGKYRRWYRENP
jgi:hypothetical protein